MIYTFCNTTYITYIIVQNSIALENDERELCMSEMRESGQKLNDETIFSFRNKSNRSCTNLWKAEEEKNSWFGSKRNSIICACIRP